MIELTDHAQAYKLLVKVAQKRRRLRNSGRMSVVKVAQPFSAEFDQTDDISVYVTTTTTTTTTTKTTTTTTTTTCN